MRFSSVRYSTPHPIIDLREIGGNIHWRVRAETVEVQLSHTDAVPLSGELLRDRTRCRCTRCGHHTDRKGGKNIRHKFVCAGCVGNSTRG